MTADENDWNMNARFDQSTLEFQPARTRQSDVQHETSRDVRALVLKEALCRSERVNLYADRLHKILESLAHRCVVVDDVYDPSLFCHDTGLNGWQPARAVVDSESVDDHNAAKTAYDIAKKIEQEMTYPGEVKVTLIRELRAVEFAR